MGKYNIELFITKIRNTVIHRERSHYDIFAKVNHYWAFHTYNQFIDSCIVPTIELISLFEVVKLVIIWLHDISTYFSNINKLIAGGSGPELSHVHL